MKKILLPMLLISGISYISADDALPAGSYQQSCKNCTLKGNTLKCECQLTDKPEKFHKTSLKMDKQDPIVNYNGNLMYSETLPEGSYQQSCNNCVFDGKTLKCLKCNANYWTKAGGFFNTPADLEVIRDPKESHLTIDSKKKPTNISNCKGKLKYGSC
ncbi:MAG TPA: CVNH domain-containing protein [Candidatus Babeliaceae bacterium]|nr:CVNH domain-containing protein [Candidatus Babeliaceae bacterium]